MIPTGRPAVGVRIGPMTPRTDQAREIGRCILEQRDAIIADWEARSLAENPQASGTERDALRNSLPQFLEQLGRTLAEGDGRVPAGYAMEHGIQRWEIGWDVAALARDFMILRRVLVRRARSVVPIDTDDVLAIAATIDEATAGSVRAFTDHREFQLKQQNETLARQNYELKRFAHMVAHEVRSPLGLVTLATASVQRRIDGLPAQARAQLENAGEQLGLIAEARRQIVEVIDNLVGFADGDLAAFELAEGVQLAEVFDKAVGNLRYFIESSGASITRGDLPAVRGNAVALRAVFQNLIENALKYAGDEHPRISISAEKEPAEKEPAGKVPAQNASDESGRAFWAIHFRDEGMGISDEDQRRIFHFLSRVNVQEGIPGSGVGLALCKRVAEQHGGSMAVQSDTGRGSTFTLRLPC